MSTDNPFYDKIVDFSTASTNGQAKSAIVVQAKANYMSHTYFSAGHYARRTPINPVEPDANGTFDVDGRESFALVAQCDQGQLEWVDMGPYECEPKVKEECVCETRYKYCDQRALGCMYDGESAFECTGSPRIHPFYDSIKKFSKHQSDWSQDAWVLALCRFKGFFTSN